MRIAIVGATGAVVLKNGPTVPVKHVGSSGGHRDDSLTLRLDGLEAR